MPPDGEIRSIARYAELLPDAFAQALAEQPIAYVPWGALEWHGPHLPLGLDGLLAENFCDRLAARVGGIVLPGTWLPITALPHPQSLSIPAPLVRQLWAALLAELQRMGFKVVALVSGHYAHPHELLLIDAAREALNRGLGILAGPPLSLLGDPALLDHAARWETSQLLAVRPDLVHLGRLDHEAGPEAGGDLARWAVLGEDPRPTATPAAGERILERAEVTWAEALLRLLADPSPLWLRNWYDSRRAQYHDWVDRFYSGSWEQALEAWWKARTSTG